MPPNASEIAKAVWDAPPVSHVKAGSLSEYFPETRPWWRRLCDFSIHPRTVRALVFAAAAALIVIAAMSSLKLDIAAFVAAFVAASGR